MISQKKLVPSVRTILAAGLWLGCAIEAIAADGLQPVFRLDLTQQYPHLTQNDFNIPIFHSPSRGQLVLIQGQCLYGGAPTAVVSDDQGRTWRDWEAFSTWPNRPYFDIVRRGNELLAFTLEADHWKGPVVWWSENNGQTWAGGNRAVQDPVKTITMNQRVLLTSSGRLIVPVEELLPGGMEGPGPEKVGTVFSDDAGRSWKRNPFFGPPPGYPTAPEGLGEPAVVELTNGKMWMVIRGLGGHLWQAWSTDDGATWGPPSATTLESPLSAVNAKRIPGTNTVVTCWNHATPDSSLYIPRTPLVFAISNDNCQTWSQPVIVDTNPQAIYPSLYFSDTEMFIAYLTVPPGVNPNGGAHIALAVYDIQSILQIAETSMPTRVRAEMGLLTNILRTQSQP